MQDLSKLLVSQLPLSLPALYPFLEKKPKAAIPQNPLASCKIPEYRDVLSTPWVGRVYIQKVWPTVSDAMLYGNRTIMVQVGTQ